MEGITFTRDVLFLGSLFSKYSKEIDKFSFCFKKFNSVNCSLKPITLIQGTGRQQETSRAPYPVPLFLVGSR